MNIGFFGHSSCAYVGEGSYLNIIADSFRAKIVNIGVKQGSEERILFELKKNKELDIAIIFHSHPRYLFVPDTDRDIDTKSFQTKRAEDIFRNDHLDIEFVKENNKLFKEKFINNDNLFSAVDSYKKYFYHQDLSMNRFYGALIQIDQYISVKNILTIHILDQTQSVIPKWFKFTSGIIDYEVSEIIRNNPSTKPFFANCVTKEGNKLIAEHLINIIAARGREVKCVRP